jgi:protein-S-isoprenylcysteine O-methyltransferase Ste14
MIAGEGLAGVAIAILVAFGKRFPKGFTFLTGTAATVAGVVLLLAICAVLARAGRSNR